MLLKFFKYLINIKYSTSNIISRIEMFTMKKKIQLFVVFCILA